MLSVFPFCHSPEVGVGVFVQNILLRYVTLKSFTGSAYFNTMYVSKFQLCRDRVEWMQIRGT